MEKILLLVNSTSGTGRGKNVLYQIVRELSVRDCEVTVYPVGPRSGIDTKKLIENRAGDFDVVVCYGGDGTLNYLVNTMMAADVKKPIGYIPGGSTNDFAQNFNEKMDVASLCRSIADGEPFTYDIGRLNKKYFNYVAAFGAFTSVSYSTDQSTKNMLGHNAYIVSAVGSLNESLTYRRHMIIDHDGITEEGDYIYGSISNSPSIGGIRFAYNNQTKLDDGLFEVMMVKAPNNPVDLAGLLAQIASGTVEDKYVDVFTMKKMSIHSEEEVEWTVDGEYGGKSKKASIEVIPQAMQIMTLKQKETSGEE